MIEISPPCPTLKPNLKAPLLSDRRRPLLDSRAKQGRTEPIEHRIRIFHGHPVLLEVDLALICGVTVAQLLDRVRRSDPIPGEFCFQVERGELVAGVDDGSNGRCPPHVFTEHGALMAAMLLEPSRGIAIGVQIVRAFVRFRQQPSAPGADSCLSAEADSEPESATVAAGSSSF